MYSVVIYIKIIIILIQKDKRKFQSKSPRSCYTFVFGFIIERMFIMFMLSENIREQQIAKEIAL